MYYGATPVFIYVLTYVLSPKGLEQFAVRYEDLSLIRGRALSTKTERAYAVSIQYILNLSKTQCPPATPYFRLLWCSKNVTIRGVARYINSISNIAIFESSGWSGAQAYSAQLNNPWNLRGGSAGLTDRAGIESITAFASTGGADVNWGFRGVEKCLYFNEFVSKQF